MIRCLLTEVTRNRHGKAVREQRTVTGDSLLVGRGSDCNIHLPDPRVNLRQALIRHGDDGLIYLEGQGLLAGSRGTVDQRVCLRPGLRLSIGPFQFDVEPTAPGHDLALAIELVQALPDVESPIRTNSRFSLAEAGWSRRAAAVIVLVLIGFAFLVLPVLHAVHPATRLASAGAPIGLDESWNPGPISAGHQSFGKNCIECHRQPFTPVSDRTCLGCHKGVGNHLQAASMQASVFAGMRCSQCHREHVAEQSPAHASGSACVRCHGNIKAADAQSQLPDIIDFRDQHPRFRIALASGPGPGAGALVRVDQGDRTRMVERSGLIFPHAVHLARKGLRTPAGQVVLGCGSCHQADAVGVGFKPITMRDHCADCHRLEFEPAITSRQVPHGPVREVMTTLREFYASVSIGKSAVDVLTIDGLLRRPGTVGGEVERKQALLWANAKADKVAADLFEVRVCKTCHAVSRNGEDAAAPWRIAPVLINQHWLPNARFAHSAHAASDCSSCHAMRNSSHSTDVAIPDIGRCRQCHDGAQPARNKVASTCASCHVFHARP